MSLNGWILNSDVLNGRDAAPSSVVIDSGVGSICSIKQSVIIAGVGSICLFGQTVQQLDTGVGSICTIKQNVINVYAREICVFNQIVTNQQQSTFLSRNRWYVQIYLANQLIPDNQLTGRVTITRTEGDSATASFVVRPGLGLQALDQYEAATVKIYLTMIGMSPLLVYTGQVSAPTQDIITGKTTFNCSDVRQNLINSSSSLLSALSSIGYYSQDVFGNINRSLYNGVYDELTNRLTTVPQSIDFDANGNWVLSNLLAKATADYTLYDSDVYREGSHDPEIKKAAWSRKINKVTVTARYNYQRAYQREVAFNWQAPFANSICDFLQKGYTVPTRAMIQQAISGAGWPVNSRGITYTPVLASGYYTCSGFAVGWSTSVNSSVATPTLDEAGQVLYQAAKDAGEDTAAIVAAHQLSDSDGNKIYTNTITKTTDYGPSLCFGASWTAAKRFTQNIEEVYTMVVTAPQSTTQYGTMEKFDNVSTNSEFNAQAWEDFKTYEAFPNINNTPAFSFSSVSNGIDKYANMDTQLNDFRQTQILALNRAKTEIIRGHRDNRVIFHKFLWPQIEVFHTVYLNCTRLQARGKVFQIIHDMDIESGEAKTKVELVLSRSTGSASSSTLSAPTRANYVPGATTPNWAASTAYIVGQSVQPSPANGYWYQCTVAGTSSGSAPGWYVPPTHAVGDTFTDGTVTWSLAGVSVADVASVQLQSHFGQDATNGYVVRPEWNGMVGNSYVTEAVGNLTNTFKTAFPVQFIVDAPGIPQQIRANAVATGSSTYNVAIQNDLLDVYFVGP